VELDRGRTKDRFHRRASSRPANYFREAAGPGFALVGDSLGDRTSGWLHARAQHSLESDPYVEIVGLVVAADVRRLGIGRELVAYAQRWARELGFRRLFVRTNVLREGAHDLVLRPHASPMVAQGGFDEGHDLVGDRRQHRDIRNRLPLERRDVVGRQPVLPRSAAKRREVAARRLQSERERGGRCR
jgi:GNAT superfamily N-acetyltransferase